MRLLIIFLLSSATLFGQKITIQPDRTEILIGDQIEMTALVQGVDMELKGLDFNGIDTAKAFDLVETSEVTTSDQGDGYVQKFIVTSFDTGYHLFPPLPVRLNQSGMEVVKMTNPIPISVRTVMPDSMGIAPIKDIILEGRSWKDYWMWLAFPLIFLLLGWVLWKWRQSANAQAEIKEVEIYVSPYDEAVESLNDLESKELWQKGEVKDYQVELSAIFRKYLERKFNFPALEWTTREIIQHLGKSKEGLPLAVIDDVLRQSDMIKFAKAEPGPEVYERQMRQVRECIEVTRNIAEEE